MPTCSLDLIGDSLLIDNDLSLICKKMRATFKNQYNESFISLAFVYQLIIDLVWEVVKQ